MVRRSALEEIGFFFVRPLTYHSCSDIYARLRLREVGQFHYVPSRLVMYSTRSFPENIWQYKGGQKYAFQRVVARYGAEGRRLARNIRRRQRSYNVNQLGYMGLQAMREGRSAEARRYFACALRCYPRSVKNAMRLMRTFLPEGLARRLTGRSRYA